MSRKQRETELRMQIILETAEKLFLLKGYDGTTMDEIATTAEFSKGTLYNYFYSKDQLYLAIATKAYEILNEYTRDFTEKESTGINQLKGIGHGYYEFAKNNPKFASIFHDVAIKIPNIDKKSKKDLSEIEKEYLKKRNEYGEIFLGIFSNAIKNNVIRTDIPNPSIMGMILSSITSGVVKEITDHREDLKKINVEMDDVIEFVFDVIAEGLKPK